MGVALSTMDLFLEPFGKKGSIASALQKHGCSRDFTINHKGGNFGGNTLFQKQAGEHQNTEMKCKAIDFR